MTNDDIQTFVKHFSDIRPFNKVLGLTSESMDIEKASVRLPMRDELSGNSVFGTIHGGAISALMDITGGFVVFLDLYHKAKKPLSEQEMQKFTRIATIDIRIDYLRPGIGEEFTASGYIIRTGNKVAVVRTELHNEKQVLIAVGTSTYIVG